MTMARGISILGSTGSIGRSALDLIDRLEERRPGRFRIAGLAAGRNADLLIEQTRRYRPAVACIADEDLAQRVREGIGDVPTRVVCGDAGLAEVATLSEADLVLAGIVGAAGLPPTYAAVEQGKTVALANKEALVMAGDLMISAARRSGARLLPVDSEHNALHQCLRGERIEEVRRLVLTASGGPFFSRKDVDLARVTPEQAVALWRAGRQDRGDRASAVDHPLHGGVRRRIVRLSARRHRHETPDPVRSDLARSLRDAAARRGPGRPRGDDLLRARSGALSVSRVRVARAGCGRRIRFDEIPSIIGSVMEAHRPAAASSLNVILQADAWAREAAAVCAAPSNAAGAPKRTGGNAACPTR
jgi:1-deoxy-D-xylulose 5-phosphate reductoisomerase